MKLILKIIGVIVGLIVIGVIGLVIFGGKALKQQKKFQDKALQTEAKINLSMAYINQKSFWAEFGVYTSAILGESPALPDNSISSYKIGFAKPTELEASVSVQVKQMHPSFDPGLYSSDKLGVLPVNERSKSIDFDALAAQHGCVAEADKFKICAIGYAGSSENLDIWTIDQNKNLVNVVDGLKTDE